MDAELEGKTCLPLLRLVSWAQPGPPSSRYHPRYCPGPRQPGGKGHTIPEAVAEHVHDLQQ